MSRDRLEQGGRALKLDRAGAPDLARDIDPLVGETADIDRNLEIPQQHMTPENFRSVAAIGRLVEALAPVA